MSPQVEVQLVAVVVAAACALPGVFLVLRRMAMMSDAISHAILPGIVLAFFLTRDLSSPLLVLAATATGLLTVLLVEALLRTGLVREDAAIGLVFPLMFSIGVLLVSRFAENVHLDTDAVLLGELAFAPLDRLILGGHDLGPRSLWVMGCVLILNLVFIILLYKELKLASFDPALASALGLAPGLVHYGLMTLVSVTAVGAFDAVGSILVVALMVAPPAAAYLLTDRLPWMLLWSVVLAAAAALGGYWTAHALDASIAGCMAVWTGLLFGITFMVAPRRGLASQILRRRRQRWEFAQIVLTVHLSNHLGHPDADEESRIEHLPQHLRWSRDFSSEVVHRAEKAGLVVRRQDSLELTEQGRQAAVRAFDR